MQTRKLHEPARVADRELTTRGPWGFFQFLQNNPYLLLFFVVGLAVWIGRVNIKGYGLGMVAGAIVVGAALSVWASAYGVKLELNNFAKSLFYYLFMYGVGLRVGPVLPQQPGRRRPQVQRARRRLMRPRPGHHCGAGVKLLDLPPGAAGGILAGSQTMSAAIGSAEQAASVIRLPAGRDPAGCRLDGRAVLWHHLHLGHGRHHPDLQVSAALVGHRCPGGGEAIRSRIRRRQRRGLPVSAAFVRSGCAPIGWRTPRLPARASRASARPIRNIAIVNVVRGDEALGADPSLVLQKGDIVALGGRIEALTDKMGLLGPEVADQSALNIPLDQAEILVTNKEVVGQELMKFRRRAVRGPAAGRQIRARRRALPGRARRPSCSAWTSSRSSA